MPYFIIPFIKDSSISNLSIKDKYFNELVNKVIEVYKEEQNRESDTTQESGDS